MVRHKKLYLEYFDFGEQDFIPCESCGGRAVDIHHIIPRGMGGDPTGKRDVIENLVALCRTCHNKAEFSTPFNEFVMSKHETKLRLWNNRSNRNS